MSITKDIEFQIELLNNFMQKYGYPHKTLVYHKGSTINGITHKIFIEYKRKIGDKITNTNKEIMRAKTSHDILKMLEGYQVSLESNMRLFAQR